MDPVCHTLVGVTLAQAGLKHRSRFATAALVVGANAPDIDGIAYVLGDSLGWRRGVTHGVLALAIWPVVLTGLFVAWHRLGGSERGGRSVPATRGRELLWLSALATVTHPTLDFMNNYGMRWLMPFVDRWFYGDALFIIDPWIWATLSLGALAGWWLGQRPRPSPRWTTPARIALTVVAVYALTMLVLGQVGRSIVRGQFAARGVSLVRDPMVAPVFADARWRYVVGDDGSRYHVTGLRWWPTPSLLAGDRVIPRNDDHPAVLAARRAPEARSFLHWARFPFFQIEDEGSVFAVTMDDARYAPGSGRSWAAVEVRVPRADARGSAAGEAEEAARRRLPSMPSFERARAFPAGAEAGSIGQRALMLLATWCVHGDGAPRGD